MLTAGEYTIEIKAETSTGALLGSKTMPITIGVVEDKVMSRFSPGDHLDNVLEIAAANDYTVYWDPFAGIFNSTSFLVNYPDPALNIRINRKWRYCEILEYGDGRVHFYIYNVDPSSTTWSVENATIQATNSTDDPNRLVCSYYDIGDITVGNVAGEFTQFAQNDRLQLTRADYLDDDSVENYLEVSSLADVTSDFNVMDGVSVSPGDVMALYGVLRPIQNDDDDIVFNEDESNYEILNRINTIQYHITGTGVDITATKDIALERIFDSGETGISKLEFKHDFLIDDAWAGKTLNVSLFGFDSHGTLVAGTAEAFQIQVD